MAAVASAFALAGCGSGPGPSTQALSEDVELRRCISGWADLGRPVGAQPVPELTLRDGQTWLRVYRLDSGRWVATCQGGPAATSGGFGAVVEDSPDDQLLFHGGYESVLKGHLLLGRPPTGTAQVQARLASGQMVQAAVDDDLFVVWKPGISVEGAQVTALDADGKVLAQASAPGP